MENRSKCDPEMVQLIGDQMKISAMKAQEMGVDGAAIALGMIDVSGFLLVHSLGKDGAREVFRACLTWLNEGGWAGELSDIGDTPSGFMH